MKSQLTTTSWQPWYGWPTWPVSKLIPPCWPHFSILKNKCFILWSSCSKFDCFTSYLTTTDVVFTKISKNTLLSLSEKKFCWILYHCREKNSIKKNKAFTGLHLYYIYHGISISHPFFLFNFKFLFLFLLLLLLLSLWCFCKHHACIHIFNDIIS